MRSDTFQVIRFKCTSLMRTSGSGLWHRNMGTHQPSKEQASSHKNKNGKKYVKHHISGQKNKHLDKRKDNGHRCD